MKNGTFRPLLLAVLTWCCCGLLAPARAQETITFVFQPPTEGITLLKTEKTTEKRTQEVGGEEETEVTVTINKTRVRYETTKTGYRYTETIVETKETVDGESHELDPIDKAFLNVPITMELDQAGRVQSISGLDAVRKKALGLMEGGERALFSKLMTTKKMDTLARAGWSAMQKVFLGPARKAGETWSVTVPDSGFSTQLIPFTSKVTLDEIGTVKGRPSALVSSTTKPELSTVAKDLRVLMEEELEMFPSEAGAKYRVLTYTNESQDCIDAVLLTTLKSLEKETKKYQISAMGMMMTFTELSTTVMTCEVVTD